MDAKSQAKVIASGFTIIRCDDSGPAPKIKIKDAQHADWCTLFNYPSKAERDRQFKAMLERSPKVITD